MLALQGETARALVFFLVRKWVVFNGDFREISWKLCLEDMIYTYVLMVVQYLSN
jgi:hypothetical protein